MAARIVTIAIGVWLMAAASTLGYGGSARLCHVVVGALAATLATVAIWEVARPLRWANLVLGGLLVIAPATIRFETVAAVNSVACGAGITAAALVRGPRRSRLGGGWSVLWR